MLNLDGLGFGVRGCRDWGAQDIGFSGLGGIEMEAFRVLGFRVFVTVLGLGDLGTFVVSLLELLVLGLRVVLRLVSGPFVCVLSFGLLDGFLMIVIL